MPGPYDYTINIPQPPANNFLQSLLGIQQLKGLQQQGQLAAQQAAIQQQQAQFAQELQPLERQKLETAIAAQKAGTSATQTSQQAAQYQLDQRKALDAELLGLSSDPSKFTPDNLQRLAVKFHSVDPTLLTRAGEMRKNLPDQAKTFGDNIAKNLVLTSVTGDSEEAIKQLDKQLEAAKNTPGLQDFVPKIEQLKDNFIKYPDQTVALAAVGQTLFAPDNAKAITDVMSEQAKIAETKAKTKKALGESATGEVEIKDVFTKKLLKDSIDKADEYSRKADTASSVLDKIDSGEVKLPSGFLGNVAQYVRDKIPMLSNDITALKKDYIRVKNSEAIKNLPKGSASDKDVAFAKEGLMSENANPEQFRKAVEAMIRLNSLDSSYNEAQAAWVSRNGNIGDAKREISVLGDMVPKGTGFREWWKKSGANLVSGQGAAPAPTKTDQITGTPALAPVYAPPSGVTIKSVR